MYEERKNTLNLKDIFLQLLLIIMFVVIMIWLFPTKSYLKDNFVGKDEVRDIIKEQLTPLYGRLFADNIESMRDAAKGYFTNERLPKKIGDSVSLTLGEMYDKKLVLNFKDSNNKSCSIDKSYVQVTKMNDEYQMKVQLSCTDFEDYIMVYMGCYDYCNGNNCQKEEKPVLPVKPTPEVKPVKPVNPDPKPEPQPEPVVKKYEYEYRKETFNEYSEWGPWSDWTKEYKEQTNLLRREIKTVEEVTGYKTEYYTVTEKVTKYRDEEYDEVVGQEKVSLGYQIVDSKDAKSRKTNGYYGDWIYKGYIKSRDFLKDTNTNKYVYVSSTTVEKCLDACEYYDLHTYKKYERTWIQNYEKYCDAGYKLEGNKCNKYEEKFEYKDIVETKTRKVAYEEEVEVPKSRKVEIKEMVEYYRYKTRTQISEAGVSVKWSESDNDKALLKAGYTLTGNKREV